LLKNRWMMDKENTDYFAEMFTGENKDNTEVSAIMKANFALFLSVANFSMIYSHLLDTIRVSNVNDEQRKQIENLPNFVIDKWIEDQLQALNTSNEEYKKMEQTMFGQIFGSLLSNPDEMFKKQEMKIKIFAEKMRTLLKSGKLI